MSVGDESDATWSGSNAEVIYQFGKDGVTPRDTRAYDRTIGAGVRFRF